MTVAAMIMMMPSNLFAQSETTNLVWQLPVGRIIDVVMTQTMEMKQTVAQQELATEMVSTNYMVWEVAEVDEAGNAMVNSEINRMTISMDGPQGKFDIDTDSDEELEGTALSVAKQVTQLVGKKFAQKMNGQGKILSVELPDEIAAGNPMVSKEAITQLVKNASPVFPDKPIAVGESWSQDSTTTMPGGMGGMKISSTYTYKGTEDVDGKDLDLIDVAMQMKFDAPEGSPIKIDITSQDTKGRMYFDSVNGHTYKIDVDQNMVMKVAAGPQTIDQSIHSRTEATFELRQ
jgi:hypothetical protein